ncbi:MAG: cytidine deaminase [Clostridiales bacterium]|nr:cytidine deaminase [Clostridiales bacterium]
MLVPKLIELAKQAAEHSYAPYSGFNVGAALQCSDGEVFLGCNIENSAYTPTVCAERVALFKAVSEGKTNFEAIAVVGGQSGDFSDFISPCGVCRQALAEFCDEGFKIYLGNNTDNYKVYTLAELLPESFEL